MRKVKVLNRISLDGYFAGPNGEIDWFIPDPDVEKRAHELIDADTLLLGDRTYRMFASFWPQVAADPSASEELRATAAELDRMTKIVFSTTRAIVDWQNTRLVNGNLAEEVQMLKRGSGCDITIFGSGTIVQQLANEQLIDEYVFIVTPVILGAGQSHFRDVHKTNLRLISAATFQSGNVIFHYTTA